MGYFFTADPHFCHHSIIKYCNRPFQDVWEMNDAIIKNWNSVVTDKDDVFLLGDIGMGKRWELIKCFYDLNGRIHWIKGNHDKKAAKWKDLTQRFEWIGDYKEIKVHDPDPAVAYRGNPYCKIVAFHYPIASWNGIHKGGWHVHGHCHGTFYDPHNRQVDVGMDCWNYTPVSYEQLKAFMATRQFVPVDGHGKKGVYKNGL